jgi:ATP-dependent DNA ligase
LILSGSTLPRIARYPYIEAEVKIRKASKAGSRLTADKMKEWKWSKPELLAQLEFLEWTGADHMRHAKFVGMARWRDGQGREERIVDSTTRSIVKLSA